jgi:hypothetical protein
MVRVEIRHWQAIVWIINILVLQPMKQASVAAKDFNRMSTDNEFPDPNTNIGG